MDKPALGHPVNIPGWLASMTPAQKNWLISASIFGPGYWGAVRFLPS